MVFPRFHVLVIFVLSLAQEQLRVAAFQSSRLPTPPRFSDTTKSFQQNKINHARSSPVPAVASSSTKLQAVPPEVLTSFLPPTIGFYKSEYTVSYGYGFAVAWTAYSVWKRCSTMMVSSNMPLLTLHAMALLFYGTRLNLFLAVRSKLSSRIQQFNAKVEERALGKGNRFTTRAPFIISCGLLYYGLSAPLLLTSQLFVQSTASNPGGLFLLSPSLQNVFKALFGVQWFGFLLAAMGDFTKTWVKQTQQDENYLVTSGIYSWIRHPNYTGECIGWTASATAGILAAALLLWSRGNSLATILSILGNSTALLIGWTGILFVLLRATSNLEERQAKDYGTNSKYLSWIRSSWSGFKLSSSSSQQTEANGSAAME